MRKIFMALKRNRVLYLLRLLWGNERSSETIKSTIKHLTAFNLKFQNKMSFFLFLKKSFKLILLGYTNLNNFFMCLHVTLCEILLIVLLVIKNPSL